MLYLTNASDIEHRAEILGNYRGVLTMTRLLAPCICIIFLAAPSPQSDSPLWIKLFNFYTLPGWGAVVLSSVALVMVLVYFENRVTRPEKDERRQIFEYMLYLPYMALQFFVAIFSWMVLSNLFIIAIGKFKVVRFQYELFLPYLGVGFGSFIGYPAWRFLSINRKIRDW